MNKSMNSLNSVSSDDAKLKSRSNLSRTESISSNGPALKLGPLDEISFSARVRFPNRPSIGLPLEFSWLQRDAW